MPQPSPRFQTESTIGALRQRQAPGSAQQKGSFKGFKIPAAARARLSDRTNSPPDA